MQKKFIIAILGIVFFGAILYTIYGVLYRAPRATNVLSDKISVTTSFYPLYFLASSIGGDLASVYSITPAGAEPHDYDLTARDMAKISSSKLLILNGVQLEPWSHNIETIIDKNSTRVITVGEPLASRTVDEDGVLVRDPHVWLAPRLFAEMAKSILEAMVQADPAHETEFRERAGKLVQQLENLDKDFRAGLSNCAKKDIITSHAAFGYLANDYAVRQLPISGLSPDEEPSPAQLAAVSAFAKNNAVSYIFFESLVSPKLAATIAREVGAKTLVLNPLEGLTDSERAAGENYFSVMRSNLNNLRIALACP